MVILKFNKKKDAKELALEIEEATASFAKLRVKVEKQINAMYKTFFKHFDKKVFDCTVTHTEKNHSFKVEVKGHNDTREYLRVSGTTELDGKTTIHFRRNLIINNLDMQERYDADELISHAGKIKRFLTKRTLPKGTYKDSKSM